MRLKKQTILELGKILKQEFNLTLEGKDLENFAYCLVGYFDLLLKIQFREEVQK